MIHSSALVENLRLNWTSCPESTVIVGWDWSAWCVLCREKPQTMIQIFSHHTLTSYRKWVYITWLYWINGCAMVYRWTIYHSCCESICRLLCDYSGPPLYCPRYIATLACRHEIVKNRFPPILIIMLTLLIAILHWFWETFILIITCVAQLNRSKLLTPFHGEFHLWYDMPIPH